MKVISDRFGCSLPGILFMVLGLLMGVAYYFNLKHEQAYENCQAQYNQTFSEQLTLRSNLFQASDDTRNRLLGGVAVLILSPPAETKREEDLRSEQFRQLFRDYQIATEEIEKARVATPLPPLPNC